jgi:hypothetical protein
MHAVEMYNFQKVPLVWQIITLRSGDCSDKQVSEIQGF